MHDKAGRLIRKTREERGLTLKDVTMATGIDGSLLSRWERGEVTKIRVDLLLPVARYLKLNLTTVASLLEEDNEAQEAMNGAASESESELASSEASDTAVDADALRKADRQQNGTPRTPKRRPAS